jgi:hypothetical protein
MDSSVNNAHTVVAMSDYQPETGYAAIAQVEAYWEAVRGARLLPKRSDIDPRGIEQALENAFILERVTVGIARLRIAGNHLNDLMGMEVRGMPLTSFFTPAARASVSEVLEEVFQTPAICVYNLKSGEAPGRPAINARMILLPLKSDLGDVSRVLGCLVAKGDLGTAPRRFDIVTKDLLQIAAGETPMRAPRSGTPPQNTPPHKKPAADRPREAQSGMAEEQAAFDAAEIKRRPPYLRLVKTDNT